METEKGLAALTCKVPNLRRNHKILFPSSHGPACAASLGEGKKALSAHQLENYLKSSKRNPVSKLLYDKDLREGRGESIKPGNLQCSANCNL